MQGAVFGESQNAVGAFDYRCLVSVKGNPHHRAAHYELGRRLVESAAEVDKIFYGCAYTDFKVFGKGDVGARNGDYPSQHRHYLGKQPVNGACGIDIENGAAGVGGQLAGG